MCIHKNIAVWAYIWTIVLVKVHVMKKPGSVCFHSIWYKYLWRERDYGRSTCSTKLLCSPLLRCGTLCTCPTWIASLMPMKCCKLDFFERGCETTISIPRTGDAEPFKRSACELPMSYYKANAWWLTVHDWIDTSTSTLCHTCTNTVFHFAS